MTMNRQGSGNRYQRRTENRPAPGLAVREAAIDLYLGVVEDKRPLDQLCEDREGLRGYFALDERDRLLARAIVLSTLRHHGAIERALARHLAKPLPETAVRARAILMTGAAQLLYLDVPSHAAVSTAVNLAASARTSEGFRGLINAVLRRVGESGADEGPALADWLARRWEKTYGRALAERIGHAIRYPAPLDLTAKGDAAALAEKLGGLLMPNGTVRLLDAGNIMALPGFEDGAFFAQDAAASLPARLLGAVAGLSVADLCAAPGGKTAQLVLAGAHVTAVDQSAARLTRLRANLKRLGLSATIVTSRLETLDAGPFDKILLDAPCSSTGTLRRNPDVSFLKGEKEILALADLQASLLDAAAAKLKPGGTLVYSTCSLEPEEGEDQARALLARNPDLSLDPIRPEEAPGLGEAISPEGYLRTLPCHFARENGLSSGLDGFFAARFVRKTA